MKRQTRRQFVQATAATLSLVGAGSRLQAEQAPAKQPNIVYVFADQMRAHALGCYGNRTVPTPHLDAMAAAGTVFDNALSTWPVCSPYRAMLLTGRYPMANGTVSNDTAVRDDLPTVAKVCKEHGYATGYIGKWHLEWNRDPFVPKDRRLGFDYWAVNNCSHRYLDNFYCTDSPEHVTFQGYEPLVQTELAVNFIKSNKGRPFCLFMSWGPPHNPYNDVPQEYKDRIPLDGIRLRENVAERAVVDQLIAWDTPSEQTARQRESSRTAIDDDTLLKERDLHGYYAHVAALDDCIGTLRGALRQAGLAENTILVFSSDHGDMLGSHRMALKQMPFEESIRVPFLIEYPQTVPEGGRSDALLTPIDVMPTLLSLAGMPCPQVDGKDFSDAAKGVNSDQRDAALIMKLLPGGGPYTINAITPWRGVRTKRYTYVHLLGHGPWLLYDNQEDPYQLDNLIDKQEHAGLRAEMENRMRALMAEAGDPGDTQAILDFRESRMPKQTRRSQGAPGEE